MDTERLLRRLDEIGESLARSGKGMALIGLGSVGVELERLDAYSDLDFFAIVRRGYKQEFIDNTAWLAAPCPISYCFRNTVDGYKLLYEDGIFCEMAVFEEAELATIPFAEGRVVWKAEGVAETIGVPTAPRAKQPVREMEWFVGEAITCLFIGLQRYHRGEKLSAQRFVQHYGVDRVLELIEAQQGEKGLRDPFVVERRYEQRYPAVGALLPQFIQGYDRSPESARALLAFLDEHFTVNEAMRERILALCEPGNR